MAAEAGIPLRTAQRWVTGYRRFGLAALACKARADAGKPRIVSRNLKQAIEGLALQKPLLPIAALYRQVRRIAEELGENAPSYGAVFNIVRGLPADLVMLAHQGAKAYGEAFELVHRREADGSNAIWQADHTPLDILLIRPNGKSAKPWLTTVIDDYSRAVAGYFLSFDAPSALHASLALRQAIWRGADMRHRRDSLNSGRWGTSTRLNCLYHNGLGTPCAPPIRRPRCPCRQKLRGISHIAETDD